MFECVGELDFLMVDGFEIEVFRYIGSTRFGPGPESLKYQKFASLLSRKDRLIFTTSALIPYGKIVHLSNF